MPCYKENDFLFAKKEHVAFYKHSTIWFESFHYAQVFPSSFRFMSKLLINGLFISDKWFTKATNDEAIQWTVFNL